MADWRAVLRLFLATQGLWVWAAHFTVIYAFTTAACVWGFADATVLGLRAVPFAIAAATLVALLAIGVLALVAWSGVPLTDAAPDDRSLWFLRAMTLITAGLGAVAVLFNALPAIMIAACG